VLVLLACRGGKSTTPDELARRGSPAAIECPAGTTMRGAAPPSGERVWCERSDATIHGPVLEWFASGQRRMAGEYADGRKQGTWKTFYDGGKPRAEEHWNAGQPTGTWTTWFADGTRATEAQHRAGGVVEFRSFRPDGSKQRAGTYVNGREDGEWTEWDAGGVATHFVWKDGVKTSAAAPAAVIGIPECDAYVSKYSRCIENRVPEAARAQMKDALQATILAWQDAAKTPAVHEGLRTACGAAMDAARTATASMGCEW
jgi:hypothetical protein